MMSNLNKTKRNFIKSFFFPLHPIKLFHNTSFILILAMMISLRIVLQYASLYIPTVGISISIAWIAILIIGWMFGPIYGLFCGVLTDTISFLVRPAAVWFWLYAIQEPLVGFIAGCFQGFYLMLKKKNNTKLTLFLLQVFVLLFLTICFISLFYLFSGNTFQGNSTSLESFFIKNSKWIILASLILFFIFIEIATCIFYKKFKNSFILISTITILICFVSIVFSFILGPISAIEYYKFLYNTDPPSFIKYGVIFYLIPRALKESIKAPVEILLLVITIPICNKAIHDTKLRIMQKWQK